MRDFNFERLYTEQLQAYGRDDHRVVTEQQNQAAPPQQASAVSAQSDQQAPNTESPIGLEQARQIAAQALTQLTKTLVDKQIGDQNWANEIFQELGKIMSNKLQDKFAKADPKQAPQQQPQPTTPTNPPTQATAPNR